MLSPIAFKIQSSLCRWIKRCNKSASDAMKGWRVSGVGDALPFSVLSVRYVLPTLC
jgi:hypothetical protein